ncbi:hypothetical protein ADK65_20445 [Streptomyces sp. NRRL B-1140]|uniref:hypothetical protein n=1 Tax=Streptomyces sp. NRRL B-1140 TaxID=1415549 RepID=UPI0006AF32C2|nr:hypothetical protein [Streptomyces sp. NRRL B-1140]KOV98711.1 hypothetical protein ADK65_20445 [Streptomyces sp. NRRL B-1140]
MALFALFGPPAITLLLFLIGVFPYALWVTRKKPSRKARLAAVGSAAALAAYGAGTFYGLAYANPLDLCATRTANGDYVDTGRDYSLESATVHHFPPSVTCHWSSGYSTNDGAFWTTPLLYAGLACATVCFTLILIDRSKRRRAPRGNALDA